MLKIANNILVLGGSGYLGQRVVHHLQREGHHVRVMTRRPHMAKAWLPHAEIIAGDAMSRDDLVFAICNISHVIVCIRPKNDMFPKAYANLATTILHTATSVEITHLTWISAEAPSLALLKKVLGTHQNKIRLFFLQSAAIIGSGSLAKTAQDQLNAFPKWFFPTRRGQRLVAIDHVLSSLSRVLHDNKKGQLTLPEKTRPPSSQNTLAGFPFGMGMWCLATRLPYARGGWLYHHMGGPGRVIAFTPDTHITWQEALPYREQRTWTEIPWPMSPKRQHWLKQQFRMAAPLKPGQYRHRCRLMYRDNQRQVWQTQLRYPIGIRIVIAEQVHVSLVPADAVGWVLGKIVRFFC